MAHGYARPTCPLRARGGPRGRGPCPRAGVGAACGGAVAAGGAKGAPAAADAAADAAGWAERALRDALEAVSYDWREPNQQYPDATRVQPADQETDTSHIAAGCSRPLPRGTTASPARCCCWSARPRPSRAAAFLIWAWPPRETFPNLAGPLGARARPAPPAPHLRPATPPPTHAHAHTARAAPPTAPPPSRCPSPRAGVQGYAADAALLGDAAR